MGSQTYLRVKTYLEAVIPFNIGMFQACYTHSEIYITKKNDEKSLCFRNAKNVKLCIIYSQNAVSSGLETITK